MKEKTICVEYNNKKYPLVFNLNVMEEIQNVYGDIQKWGEIVENNHDTPKIKDLKFGLKAMINEGLDIENETSEVKRELLNDKQVGRLLTSVGLAEITNKIKEATTTSTKVDEKPKNV